MKSLTKHFRVFFAIITIIWEALHNMEHNKRPPQESGRDPTRGVPSGIGVFPPRFFKAFPSVMKATDEKIESFKVRKRGGSDGAPLCVYRRT